MYGLPKYMREIEKVNSTYKHCKIKSKNHDETIFDFTISARIHHHTEIGTLISTQMNFYRFYRLHFLTE